MNLEPGLVVADRFRLEYDGTNSFDAHWATGFSAEDLDVTAVDVSRTESPSGGAVYVGGTAFDTLVVAGGVPIYGEQADLFVTRLDRATGAHLSTARCGDAAEQVLAGLAFIRDEDDMFFAAEIQGSIDLGGAQQHSSGAQSSLLVGQLRTGQ